MKRWDDMKVKPKLNYKLYTTELKLDSTKIYKAEIATNQPDFEKQGLIFVNEILLNKDEYIIIES